LDAGKPYPAGEESEEDDDSGQYANVNGEEDARRIKSEGIVMAASYDPHAKHGICTRCSEVLDN